MKVCAGDIWHLSGNLWNFSREAASTSSFRGGLVYRGDGKEHGSP